MYSIVFQCIAMVPMVFLCIPLCPYVFLCLFMVIVGVCAFFLRLLDYPVAPAVLAIVLGPIAEPKLRQSLLFSDGDFMIFLNRPIAGPITVIAIILIFLPLLKLIRDKMRQTA